MSTSQEIKTLVIDNFHGSCTPYADGDINSGLCYIKEVFGYNPFGVPGNLTWYEDVERIDPTGSVITDLMVAGKTRIESGILYFYGIGHTGRLYKIQINNPATYDPDYNNPVLLATLTDQSPTFKYGGFMDFFGSTERIYIGHDKGVTRIEFDGTGETFVGALGSWVQNVPRPMQQFTGSLYIGNGTNIAQIDSTATVSTYTKLSPAFPTGTQVRDIDVTPDGNYLQMVVTETPLRDITLTTPDTSVLQPSDSFLFSWDGITTGYTSFITYSSTMLTANCTFGDQQYLIGYDAYGGAVYNPVRKLIGTSPITGFEGYPLPNAVFGLSNMVYWAVTIPFDGHKVGLIDMYGGLSDLEYQSGYWSPASPSAEAPETDIQRIGMCIPVSNSATAGGTSGYTDNIYGVSQVFYSTIETSDSTTVYKLYKWSPNPQGLGNATVGAVYETQRQLFQKKCQLKQVRIYGDPWADGVAFTIDLIGSDGNPIPNASKSFTTASNLTIGNDFAWYTPQGSPTYIVGCRITNNGTTNHVISKIEIDYALGGQ